MNAPSGTLVDRRAERVHLFLVATLYCEQASNPVRVRNLSATGALIEGASLPPVGTAIILRRGALEAPGTVVWAVPGKAGLSFGGLVDVSAWLPAKDAKPQTQVDQIAFGLKHAAPVPASAAAPTPAFAPAAVAAPLVDDPLSMAEVVAELVALKAQLGQLGDKLAEDAILLASHPEVQFLDAAGQRIGKIVDAIRTASQR